MPVIDRTVNRHNVIYGTSEMKRMTGIRLYSPHFFFAFSFLFFPPFFRRVLLLFPALQLSLVVATITSILRNETIPSRYPFICTITITFEHSFNASDKEREISGYKRYWLITLVFFRRKLIFDTMSLAFYSSKKIYFVNQTWNGKFEYYYYKL